MQLFVGTSGYSYKQWLGKFYPEKLAQDAMLRYYAERLNSVEINNTFYRMPAENMLARWATEVPGNFEFTLKAPRRITHEKRLRETQSDVTEFIRRAQALNHKLGALLFQLPPFLKKDVPRLTEFVDAVSTTGPRLAFEFRNDTWQSEDVYEALRARNAMFCVTDTEQGDTPFVTTCDCGYLRLRRTHYSDDELKAWATLLAAQTLDRMFVYFMHEDDALGAQFALRLNEFWEAQR